MGKLPAKFQRMIARMNEKILPWVKVLVMTIDAQPMRRMSSTGEAAWLDVRDVLRSFPERSKGRFTI